MEDARWFEQLIEDASDGFIAIDADQRILLFNRRAAQLFGYEPTEVLGRPLSLLLPIAQVHTDDRDEVRAAVASALDRKGHYEIEHRVVRPGGVIREVREQGEILVDARGNPMRMVGTVQDVTEQRELQTRLRQTQRTEAIGRLAGGVAHNFNNLLCVILEVTGFMDAQLSDDDPLADDVRDIGEAARRAATLMGQLLAFGRRQVLAPTHVCVNEVLTGLKPLLHRLAGEHIRIKIELHADLDPVFVDESQLEQVIINLAANARDAMRRGGVLRLSTERLVVNESNQGDWGCVSPGQYSVLQVSDTGVGLDPDQVPHIFEPFFTTKSGGTGLGLATVYGIDEQSGGHISVQSKRDAGTSFTVLLPPAPTAEIMSIQEPTLSVAPRRAAAGRHILVVEDEAGVRKVLARTFAAAGYEVTEACDGAVALESFEAGANFDLALTDVVMPRIGGPELVERIHERHPEQNVLFMTGYSEDETLAHGLAVGHTKVVTKPFSQKRLLQAAKGEIGAQRTI